MESTHPADEGDCSNPSSNTQPSASKSSTSNDDDAFPKTEATEGFKIDSTEGFKIDSTKEYKIDSAEEYMVDSKKEYKTDSVEENKVDTAESHWAVGDVVWCLQSGQPWWPCIVTKDYILQIHQREIAGSGGKLCQQYHVQFCGPDPLHAWVYATSIRPFRSLEDLEIWKRQETEKWTSKSKAGKVRREIVMKRFAPTNRKVKEAQLTAAREAFAAKSMTVELRLETYEFEYETSTKKNIKGLDEVCYVPRKKRASQHGKTKRSLKSSSSHTPAAKKKKLDSSDNKPASQTGSIISSAKSVSNDSSSVRKTLTDMLSFDNSSLVPTFDSISSPESKPEHKDGALGDGILGGSNAEHIQSPLSGSNQLSTPSNAPTVASSLSSKSAPSSLPPKSAALCLSPKSAAPLCVANDLATVRIANVDADDRLSIASPTETTREARLVIDTSRSISVSAASIDSRVQTPSIADDDSKVDDFDIDDDGSDAGFHEDVGTLSPRTENDLFRQFCLCHYAEMKTKLPWLTRKETITMLEEHWQILKEEERMWYVYNFLTPRNLSPAVVVSRPANGILERLFAKRRSNVGDDVITTKKCPPTASQATASTPTASQPAASTPTASQPTNPGREVPSSPVSETSLHQPFQRRLPQVGPSTHGQQLQPRDERDKPPPDSPKPEVWEIEKLNAMPENTSRRSVICCQTCCKPCNPCDDIVACNGPCLGVFHARCLGYAVKESDGGLDFECSPCRRGEHACFVCRRADKETKRCLVNDCWKFYHSKCATKFDATEVRNGSDVATTATAGATDESCFKCPRHVCLECWLEDPQNPRCRSGKLVQCVKCPLAYHDGGLCVPAGSKDLGGGSILCASHVKDNGDGSRKPHVNVGFCFACSDGGDLVCCDSCPAAFHVECVPVPTEVDDGKANWFCDQCLLGKKPRYGEVVWAKVGDLQWWPGEVIHPQNVPAEIRKLKGSDFKLGQFPVRLFATNKFEYLDGGHVYHYVEGDSDVTASNNSDSGSSQDRLYQEALQKAARAYEAVQKVREVKRRKFNETVNKRPSAYEFIRTNQPFGEVIKRLAILATSGEEVDVPICECKPEVKPCSDDECLNRLLLYECNPSTCPCGIKCQNQRFRKRIYPKLSVFKTPNDRGWGLKIGADVPAGSFIAEYVGELIDDEEAKRRLNRSHDLNETNFYMLTIDSNTIIDAGPKGNQSRFINHSCDPNCETQKWNIDGMTRVGIFARNEIKAGSELTFNYQFECKGDEKTVCHCGASSCSGFLGVRVKGCKDRKSSAGSAEIGENLGASKGKQQRRKKLKPLKVTDDWCYRCLEGGELVLCDLINCPHGYHLECLGRDSLPVGKWCCPRHYCDYCTKTATKQCSLCPASFCHKHDSEENIYVWKRGEEGDVGTSEALVCTDHTTEERQARFETLRKEERERDERFRVMEEKRMIKNGASRSVSSSPNNKKSADSSAEGSDASCEELFDGSVQPLRSAFSSTEASPASTSQSSSVSSSPSVSQSGEKEKPKCSSVSTGITPLKTPQKSCPDCGKLVACTNLQRHRRSGACGKKRSEMVQQEVTSSSSSEVP